MKKINLYCTLAFCFSISFNAFGKSEKVENDRFSKMNYCLNSIEGYKSEITKSPLFGISSGKVKTIQSTNAVLPFENRSDTKLRTQTVIITEDNSLYVVNADKESREADRKERKKRIKFDIDSILQVEGGSSDFENKSLYVDVFFGSDINTCPFSIKDNKVTTSRSTEAWYDCGVSMEKQANAKKYRKEKQIAARKAKANKEMADALEKEISFRIENAIKARENPTIIGATKENFDAIAKQAISGLTENCEGLSDELDEKLYKVYGPPNGFTRRRIPGKPVPNETTEEVKQFETTPESSGSGGAVSPSAQPSGTAN